MVNTIVNVIFKSHSPRFKPWAMGMAANTPTILMVFKMSNYVTLLQ
jgi:hypothetical protein